MLILGLDTASSAAAVCVWRDGVVLASFAETMARGQDARLLPLVQQALEEARVGFTDLDGIAVTKGPGSFTGVRVGLAAAKGLGLAAAKPVWGVDRFVLHRAQHLAEGGRGDLLIVLESKRAELFAQYTPEGGPSEEALMATPDCFARYGACCVRGDAFDSLGALWPGAVIAPLREAEILTACRLVAENVSDEAAFLPTPFYLRPPDVTVKKPLETGQGGGV